MSKRIADEAMKAATTFFPGLHWTAEGDGHLVEGRHSPSDTFAALVLYRTLRDFGSNGRKSWWECGSLTDSYGNAQGVSAQAAAILMRRKWGAKAHKLMSALYGNVPLTAEAEGDEG
jgi:hypothetical protein